MSDRDYCVRDEDGRWYAGCSDPFIETVPRLWSPHLRARSPLKPTVAKRLADEVKGIVVELLVTEKIVYRSGR